MRRQHYLQLQLGQSTVLVDIDHVEVLLRKVFLFLTEESDRLFHPRFFAQLRGLLALLVEFNEFGRGGLQIANGGSCLHLASNSIGRNGTVANLVYNRLLPFQMPWRQWPIRCTWLDGSRSFGGGFYLDGGNRVASPR